MHMPWKYTFIFRYVCIMVVITQFGHCGGSEHGALPVSRCYIHSWWGRMMCCITQEVRRSSQYNLLIKSTGRKQWGAGGKQRHRMSDGEVIDGARKSRKQMSEVNEGINCNNKPKMPSYINTIKKKNPATERGTDRENKQKWLIIN